MRELWDCNYNKRRKIEKRKCVLSVLLITNVTLLTPMKRIASLFCLSFWPSSLYLQEGWEYLKLFDKYKMTNDAWFWPVKCFIEGFIFPAKYWFFILLLKSLQHIIVFASKNTSMFYWRLFVIYYFLLNVPHLQIFNTWALSLSTFPNVLILTEMLWSIFFS